MNTYFLFGLALFTGLLSASCAYAALPPSTQPSAEAYALIQQLQEQIKALQARVEELQAQVAASPGDAISAKPGTLPSEAGAAPVLAATALPTATEETTAMEFLFTKSIQRGDRGPDVRKLQEFLSRFPDIYPLGLVTGFYGQATEAAVKKLQSKYGIEQVGIIGPRTLSKINQLITEGAGKSGVIPPGLMQAPGIERKGEAWTTGLSPSIPAGIAAGGSASSTAPAAIPAVPATPGFMATSSDIASTPAGTVPAQPAIPPSASPATATTTSSLGDTVAPSVPTGLTATPVYDWYITLAWPRSTDTVGVVGYKVYRGGALMFSAATSSSLSTLAWRDWGSWDMSCSCSFPSGATYSYTVAAYDAAGNVSAQSSAVAATTWAQGAQTSSSSSGADSSPPVISGVQTASITTTSAVVSWTTDESSDSQVRYGLDIGYSMQTILDANRVTSHSLTLTGLTAGRTYHYQVKSKDAGGNLATSGDQTFTTASAPAQPSQSPITLTSPNGGETWDIYNYNYSVRFTAGVSRVGLKILKGSQIVYSGSEPVSVGGDIIYRPAGTASLNLDPRVYAASVGSGSDYKIRVFDWDASGTYDDSDGAFSIPAADITPPVVSGVTASAITANSAVITWTTDEPALGYVNYGSTPSNWAITPYDNSSAAYVTAHSYTLSNLSGNTAYTYRVYNTDARGNSAVLSTGYPPEYTFTTLSAASSTSSLDDRAQNLAAISQALNAIRIQLLKILRGQ